jgi:hypothetical protein
MIDRLDYESRTKNMASNVLRARASYVTSLLVQTTGYDYATEYAEEVLNRIFPAPFFKNVL